MVGKTLEKDQGITFQVFEPETDETQILKHVLVPEVVREEKMHYYRVPQLGSYLAIKLEYNSCLFEEAFDAAIADYTHV